MKKIISILALVAVLFSLCACGADPTPQVETTQPAVEETSPVLPSMNNGLPTNEEKFGHINQFEPIDGVYKIWNPEGVKNIANHPEGTFELLCTIDMEGAVLAPIGTEDKPFTGDLKGANFFLQNFTVQGGEEESFGFIGVNKGTVRNLVLENVTFIPGGNAKNIGAVVGLNEGTVNRCTVNSGVMTVEAAPEGANCGGIVGMNLATLTNTTARVDLAFNAETAANVGGIAGTAKGGTLEFVNTEGKLDIVGNNKTAGLFAGYAEGAVFNKCAFTGASNRLNGELFLNFTGNAQDNEREVALEALWRDNSREELPENVRALRNKVVQAMYELGTVEWHVKEDVVHSCTCQLSACHGTYNKLYTNYGTPYNHKSSSLARMKYCLGDDNVMDDWVYEMERYDGFDNYFGTDCSSSVWQAWVTVSNSVTFWTTSYMMPAEGMGTIPVGDYVCDFKLTGSPLLTQKYLDANDEQTIYEAYGQIRAGDAYTYLVKEGGHTRMAAEDAVVVRNQDGLIDPDYSYVISHEQGMSTMSSEELTFSSWRINYKYTFSNLYFDTAIPLTCEELLTGEMEPVEATLEGACDGYVGMFSGTVKSNYNIDSVRLTITDSAGQEILNHPMWVSVVKTEDWGGNAMNTRSINFDYDMTNFAIVLSQLALEKGETYAYTVTAGLSTFDQIVIHESSFVYGQ